MPLRAQSSATSAARLSVFTRKMAGRFSVPTLALVTMLPQMHVVQEVFSAVPRAMRQYRGEAPT